MTITVLIPTYRRPCDLSRCLEALRRQIRPAEEIIIVVREDDQESISRVESTHLMGLSQAVVRQPGQIAALNAGLESAQGDIIAITDDDTAPRPDWLLRIVAHFEDDPHLDGLGGRDWVHHDRGLEDSMRPVVGKLTWYGRVIGNHHLGCGSMREVDVLKGANMSYRRSALAQLRFDTQLRGTGAQVHNDMGFSLSLKKGGHKIQYDPAVEVDHYPALRHDNDQLSRGVFATQPLMNAVHNETYLLLQYVTPIQRLAYLFYIFLIGTRAEPGVLQVIRLLIHRQPNFRKRYQATLSGRLAGIHSFLWPENNSQRKHDAVNATALRPREY